MSMDPHGVDPRYKSPHNAPLTLFSKIVIIIVVIVSIKSTVNFPFSKLK